MKTVLATLGAFGALLVLAVTGTRAADEYRIGYLNSFSGYLANMGTVSRDGFLLAIDEINKRGGVNGRQLRIIVENDESDPSKGVPAAIRLINAEKVLAMVGPARSDVTEPVGPIAAKAQVVDMTCSFILPTQGDYTFATVPTPEEEARVAIEFLKRKGARSIGILNAIDLYDKISAKAFAEEAGKHGIKVVATESYNAAVDKNFIPQLTTAKYGDYPVMANWWTAQNYDIAFLPAEALKRAGPNATGASLKAALEGIKNFEGVVGTFSFAPDLRAGARGIVVARIEGERLVLVK